ncbi:hypothetical protein NVIE_0753 [Nitrososphaera viennensis EN76]|uniref:Uncharacterized protein n=1 Tax=Nitrososphaera viennensis EN76 TaxID=926571 RepID=A0A060HN25_9ARCH|nr:hypothetical protein NVIE_0753 [Nitrososphaera viennensis EN76]
MQCFFPNTERSKRRIFNIKKHEYILLQ